MARVRVSCRQVSPCIGDLAGNIALSVTAVRSAVEGGAHVVVLPELVTSGYMFASREEVASVAIEPDHEVFRLWAREASMGAAVVVGGFCERGTGGRVYNSAAVVDGSGVRAVYRKTHLWDREKLWFERGNDLPPVVDTAAGRIGVAVCYDIEFPELTRYLALAGAELVAVPTNWPLVERPVGERPPEVVIAMAAARTNRMAIACCDRAGEERGQVWTAGSTIVGVDGWPLAAAGDGDEATADIDLSAARDKRLTDRSDVFGDRRTDLYDAGAGPRSPHLRLEAD
ncbi:MAG: nitrilase-related carbon-nitrogen hydrolase [Mycobacteriales bacterium]